MRATMLLLGLSALVLSGRGVVAQVPDGWPSHIDADVRERIAERWDVRADKVRLSWGVYRSVPAPGSSIELMGSGRGGHWAVRIMSPGGETSTVRLTSGHEAVMAVAARRLERGATLVADDVVFRDTTIWNHPTGDSTSLLEGWVTHRRIEMGELLAHPTVQPPMVVEAGRSIDLIWSSGAIGVRLKGVATGSGAVGEEVLVRTESGARLRGIVVAPGTVRLTHAGPYAIPGGAS